MKFHFRLAGYKTVRPNRKLGKIVTSFQDFKLLGKQIFQSFSYCELRVSPRNGTKVSCSQENKKMKRCQNHSHSPVFGRPEFSCFWYIKTQEGKLLSNGFLLFLSVHCGDFINQIRNLSYTV